MTTLPRNRPRFLPTLTEVVLPTSVDKAVPLTQPDLEDTVKLVMQRVDEVIERRLRDEFNVLLQTRLTEQLHSLVNDLRQELVGVVRQAVSEAVNPLPDEHHSKY